MQPAKRRHQILPRFRWRGFRQPLQDAIDHRRLVHPHQRPQRAGSLGTRRATIIDHRKTRLRGFQQREPLKRRMRHHRIRIT